jgi:hypothetical protein
MLRTAAWLLVALVASGCGGTPVDLTKGLQVLDVSTGWLDVGIVNGQNKLVPWATFKIKNVSDQTLIALQINALYRRVTEPDEWGSAFLRVTGSEGLAPGQTTPALVARSQLGYTGSEARREMLRNAQFVDAKVELYAKYGSVQWKRIGEYPISRNIIEKK